jgi:hypothetical protein
MKTRNSIRITRDEVQVTIDGNRVVREVLRAMERQNPDLYEGSPGFMGVAVLAEHQSSAFTAAIARCASTDSALWERIEHGVRYLRDIASPLPDFGKAIGYLLNGLLAAGSAKATLAAALAEAWGAKDDADGRVFDPDDIATFLTTAACTTFEIPNADGKTEVVNGAAILRGKAEIGANDNKSFAALCQTAEQYAETGNDEHRLTGEDCVQSFVALRPDATPIAKAPERVRRAASARTGDGQAVAARA